MQYLTFHVGDREFAVDLARVREIVNSPPITRVPGMPAALLGLVGLRGDPTAVVDAGLRLAGRRTVPGGRTPLIVLTTLRDDRASLVALLVEAAGRRLELETLLPWDDGLARIVGADACAGFAAVEGSLVIVLDVDRLLAFERVAAASALALPAPLPAGAKSSSIVARKDADLRGLAADAEAPRTAGPVEGRRTTAQVEASTTPRPSRSEPLAPAVPPAAGSPSPARSSAGDPSASATPSPASPRPAEPSLRAPSPLPASRTASSQAAGLARATPPGQQTGRTPPTPTTRASTDRTFEAEPLPIGPFARPPSPTPPVPVPGERAHPPGPEPLVAGSTRTLERRNWTAAIVAIGALSLLAALLAAFLRPAGSSERSARRVAEAPSPPEVRAESTPYRPTVPAFEPPPSPATRAAKESAPAPAPEDSPGSASASAPVAEVARPAARRPLPPSMVVTPDTPPCEIHVVRRGDTLWDISAERLGNPYRWPRLFGENRGHILDPDVIEIDDRIRIPGACRPPGGE